MKHSPFLVFFFFSSLCLIAQESTKFKAESSVSFSIKNFGVNVHGHFENVSISIIFNSENEIENVSASIMVNSITTGMNSRDNHILKKDFFDEPNYKTILFKSSKITQISSNSFQADANLTIKNITKKINIPIYLSIQNNAVTIRSNFKINRKDFDIGGSSLVLGKTVKINVRHIQNLN